MKPKYQIGQILMMDHFVAPDFYEGEPVAVVQIKPATYSIRYQIKRIGLEKTGWVDEDALRLPMMTP
jgi:hypothetical protein